MIHDRLDRAAIYRTLSPTMAKAIDFAMAFKDDVAAPLGRIDIAGDELFGISQTYQTKPLEQAKWEAHRKYIDLQLMLAGSERMDVADVDTLQSTALYDGERDVEFFDGVKAFQPVVVQAGHFAIFYPHDAHRPTVAVESPAVIRKLVLKIRVG